MSLTPTESERALLETLRELKAESGSHSPSIYTLLDRTPGLHIEVDACFLSNPYAADLFFERLSADLIGTGELRRVLEFYPSQNHHVAALIASTVGVDGSQIFACNGAVEAIQAALHRFAGTRVGVVLPTFSPYYEYLRPDQTCHFHRLRREDDFELDVDELVAFVADNEIDTVCLINPNNPTGGYVPSHDMRRMLEAFAHLELVVLDESFVDFAYEDEQRAQQSLASDVAAMPNVVLVKSMSKDFGVSGLRAGYAVMSPERVGTLLENGYLWNMSGLAEYFFRLFGETSFQERYALTRLKYLDEATEFFAALGGMPLLRAYATKANFCLVELDPSVELETFVGLLLARHGVYVRDCRDKIGLEGGQYLRVASRRAGENGLMLEAMGELLACA